MNYPPKTIYEMVHDTALQYPHHTACEFLGRKTSYRQFLSNVHDIARAFFAAGIRKGHRVSICMPNCPQAAAAFYALNRIGAVSNMIHPLCAPEEMRFYLDFSHSKAILLLDSFYPKFSSIRSSLKAPVLPIVTSAADGLSPAAAAFYTLSHRPAPSQYLLWRRFLQNGKTISLPPHDGKADDCACILYSGGTTGTAKGVALSSRNFNALALQTIAASGFSPITGLKMLCVMPMFHGFGLGIGIHTALVGGAHCILVPRFSVDSYAKLLRKKKPHIIPGVPTLFEALLRAKSLRHADLSFLKGVFCGGDSLSIELKRKVDDFLAAHNAPVQIRQGYGLTECVTASCLTPPDCHKVGAIGIPFPDMVYKIVTPNTENKLPPDTEGEICISGPTLMLGYLDNPEETALALRCHADGRLWLHTGDLGKMDADGFVYFTQRIKRIIVTSGYNVYPSQLENILDSHEKVLLSCVIGMKDPYKMQKIKAFVVLQPHVPPTENVRQELFAYCRQHIAKYAVPCEIEFRDDLPKTLVGKVAYRILEEETHAP